MVLALCFTTYARNSVNFSTIDPKPMISSGSSKRILERIAPFDMRNVTEWVSSVRYTLFVWRLGGAGGVAGGAEMGALCAALSKR